MRRFLYILAAVLFIALVLLILASIALYIAGCAPHIPLRVSIPRECIDRVELTPKTNCTEQKDGSLRCGNLLLTFRKGCEVVKIK